MGTPNWSHQFGENKSDCDRADLEATQGQNDSLFSQLPYKCYLEEVASVGDWLKICPWVTSRAAGMQELKEQFNRPRYYFGATFCNVAPGRRCYAGWSPGIRIGHGMVKTAHLMKCCGWCCCYLVIKTMPKIAFKFVFWISPTRRTIQADPNYAIQGYLAHTKETPTPIGSP